MKLVLLALVVSLTVGGCSCTLILGDLPEGVAADGGRDSPADRRSGE